MGGKYVDPIFVGATDGRDGFCRLFCIVAVMMVGDQRWEGRLSPAVLPS